MKQIITNFNNAPKSPSRISWSGIVSGTISIFSVLIMAHILGKGIGVEGFSAGMAWHRTISFIWALAVNAGAVFLGAVVCVRSAAFNSHWTGGLHGFLCWAVYAILSTILYLPVFGVDLGTLMEISPGFSYILLFLIAVLALGAGIYGGIVGTVSSPDE